MTTDLRSLFSNELEQVLAGHPAFRAKQIFDWLQRKGVASFDEMTNLPNKLRHELRERFELGTCEIARKQVSQIDGTIKYLFRLRDGALIESVVMDYEHGRSICLSTQVGCRMGCVFCATGAQRFERDLTAGEMLAQVYALTKEAKMILTAVYILWVNTGEIKWGDI